MIVSESVPVLRHQQPARANRTSNLDCALQIAVWVVASSRLTYRVALS